MVVIMGTHFYEEIIMDILSWLPVKSALRFKCVSISWKTLISEPYFKKKHLNQAKNQSSSQKMILLPWPPTDKIFYCSSLSLVQLVKDSRRFDWPTNSKPSSGITVYPCCCDGLVLVGIWNKTYQEEPSILLIWNPSTGESVVLPPPELSLEDDSVDDTKEPSVYGLGYDSISDDYKVLKVDRSEDYQKDEIFTLKSGCWRKIDETSGKTDNTLLSEAPCLAFIHGAFHWLGLLSNYTMISFNISNERYGEIPLPEIICLFCPSLQFNVDMGLSVLGAMLCVYYTDETTFNLWVMKDYSVKESWTKLFTIPNNGVPFITPIHRFSDHEVLLSYENRGTIKTVYRIISSGSFRLSIRIWPLDGDYFDAVTIDQAGIVYTESLISPRLGH